MDAILFSASDKMPFGDGVKHLEAHDELYFEVKFPIRKEKFSFPIFGFVHVKGRQVEYRLTIAAVRAFFMWCTILNAGLLLLSFLVCAFAGDWIYRMHSRWFPMPRETFTVVLYSFLGAYKLAIWLFNAVPYVALVLVG